MNRSGNSLSAPATVQHTRIHFLNYLWLLLICLLAYWPLTSGFFSVKNDAIHYFLPYRFNISEAIRNGEFPFWSPYIYNGYPVYGDMQSGAWNPVVWLFSCIGRYDLTLFHFENLLYIFLGGIGMYILTWRLTRHGKTALLTAVSYMLSGFMLSGQLINWLAAAAFIPFVFHYFTLLLKNHSYKTAIQTAVSLYLLFTAGYPSFFIVTLYMMGLLFLLSGFRKPELKKKFLSTGLLVLVFSLLSMPAFLSYLELMPYYQRGQGILYQDAIINSFEWIHLRSFLFPSAIHAADVQTFTDTSFRNVYIGLLPLALLFCFPPKAGKRTILLIAGAGFALLFSLGDVTPVRKFCFEYLPLMNTFRHPAQLRLFLMLALLLLAAPGLKELMESSGDEKKRNRFRYALGGLAILIIVILTLAMPQSFYSLKRFTEYPSVTVFIKDWVNYTTLSYTLLINGIIQLLFIAAFFIWGIRGNLRVFSLLWISNLFIMAQLLLPVSFVSSHPTKEANRFLHQQPTGFPVTYCDSSLAYNSSTSLNYYDNLSLLTFYNKKPGISQITNSPSFLTSAEAFILNTSAYSYVSARPVVYLADSLINGNQFQNRHYSDSCEYALVEKGGNIGICSNNKTARLTGLSANQVIVETIADQPSFLILTQHFHKNWAVAVDGQPASIIKANISFMGVQLPSGKHTVHFRFTSKAVSAAIWPMAITFLILTVAGILSLIGMIKNKTY